MYIQKKLSNGVRVVIEKLAEIRSVTLGIWVKAGSVNETKETNGISHFIEHMLFKGTEKRSYLAYQHFANNPYFELELLDFIK